ncbi:MAG: hypothetical protein COB46_01745 [Rhodospirillaceae bacterium]|nr:MAG: hypothetical protein COB46_01745 [Rhodospirillaceae bacterium]
MKSIAEYNLKTQQKRALVVFSDQADLAWLRVLRPGFRHCFVLIKCGVEGGDAGDLEGSNWVLYNPLSTATQISLWAVHDDKVLKNSLVQQGYCIVETYVRPLTVEVLPWRPFTCVEAVKRSLGLHKSSLFTPYGLYKFLLNENKVKKILDFSQQLGY